MKELIYTGIFVALGILLILLLVYMFAPKDQKSSTSADAAYIPGVYTSSITLGGNAVDVAVTVSDNLADQICETQSLDGLDYSEETQYTSQVILGAVERALEKAKFPSEE